MEKHKDEFRERMRTATKERRQRSKRFRARVDIAAAVKRIQPKLMGGGGPPAPWMELLSGRRGWHGLHSEGSREIFIMFVAAYENVTYALNVSAFCENIVIEFSGDFRLSDYLTPLN
jgi:hypothetical protein